MQYGFLRFLIIVTLLSLSACGGGGSSSSDGQPTTGGDGREDELIGVWTENGYGLYLEVSEDRVKIYEAAESSCIETADIERIRLLDVLGGTNQEMDGSTAFSLVSNGNTLLPIAERRFSKVNAVPESCETLAGDSAVEVVSHLAAMVSQYHAFLNERGVNWGVEVANALVEAQSVQTDEQLKDLLANLLSTIHDPHVVLVAEPFNLSTDDQSEYLERAAEQLVFTEMVASPEYVLATEFYAAGGQGSPEEYIQGEYLKIFGAIESQLDGPLQSSGGANEDAIFWGTLQNGRFGYIAKTELEGIDPDFNGISDISPTVPVARLTAIMNDIAAAMQGIEGVIVDLRFAPGGTSSLDRVFTSYLINQTFSYADVTVGSEQAVSVSLDPVENSSLAVPKVVLSGAGILSSAEDIVLALRAAGNTMIVGESTAGALSDMLFLQLPNGWVFSVSNQVWRDHNGIVWEVEGIPPNIEREALPKADRDSGMDTLVQFAEEWLTTGL